VIGDVTGNFNNMIDMPTLITTIGALVAIILSFVTIQQYFLAREQFKLGLFEKRFSIFKAIETLLNETIRDHFLSLENLSKFDKATQTADYLFDSDIVDFISDIRTKGNVITQLHKEQELHEGGSPQRMALGERKEKLLIEFIKTTESLKEKFSPYLKFRKWKFGFLTGIFN
jgi:hypothetical protein